MSGFSFVIWACVAASLAAFVTGYFCFRRGSLFVAGCEWLTALIFLGIGGFVISGQEKPWPGLGVTIAVAAFEVAVVAYHFVAWIEVDRDNN